MEDYVKRHENDIKRPPSKEGLHEAGNFCEWTGLGALFVVPQVGGSITAFGKGLHTLADSDYLANLHRNYAQEEERRRVEKEDKARREFYDDFDKSYPPQKLPPSKNDDFDDPNHPWSDSESSSDLDGLTEVPDWDI